MEILNGFKWSVSRRVNVHYSKGKQHGHKRYCTGKRKTKKQKTDTSLELLASKGKSVTFRKDKICLGWVMDRVREEQFIVESKNLGMVGKDAGCTYIVKEINQPVLLTVLPSSELLERGAQVLFVWDWVPGSAEFIELRPAVFLCRERDYVWVKPNGVHAVRTEITVRTM